MSVEQHQRSLAEYLIKTSFTLVTGLGGLAAILSTFAGALQVTLHPVTMFLLWTAVGLLLFTTVSGWKVLSTATGTASDQNRENALQKAKRMFAAALVALVISPVGLILNALTAEATFDMQFTGTVDGMILAGPGDLVHSGLVVTSNGDAIEPSVEVLPRSKAGITVVAPAPGERLSVFAKGISVVYVTFAIDSTTAPGSYPFVLELRDEAELLAAAHTVIVVSAPEPPQIPPHPRK